MRQLFLSEDKSLSYLLEDYIISNSNETAFNLSMQFSEDLNYMPQSCLLIVGDSSSGKSFLLNIWKDKVKAQDVVISNDFNINQLDSSRPAALDNIDLIDEVILLHIFNWCVQKNIPLLMTAKNHRNFKLPDLSSRINALQTVFLEQPDDLMIRIFVAKQFSDLGIKIANNVINFISNNIQRDFYAIQQFITLINQESLSSNQKISIDTIKQLHNRFNQNSNI
jgi:chromosomal replication initiation ATPase DnaA